MPHVRLQVVEGPCRTCLSLSARRPLREFCKSLWRPAAGVDACPTLGPFRPRWWFSANWLRKHQLRISGLRFGVRSALMGGGDHDANADAVAGGGNPSLRVG